MKRRVDTRLNELSSDHYQQHFEIEFLQDAEDFYRQKTVGAIKSDSVVEYLFQVNFFVQISNLR